MQIYKIYINEKELLLTDTEEAARKYYASDENLFVRYTGQPKSIFQCIDALEKGTPYERIILYGNNYKTLKKAVKSLFIIIKAAGGLVVNENGEGLFIYRLDTWDLPKGKAEADEEMKQTAVREVIEETGIESLDLERILAKTKHVYRNRSGARVLKITHWYEMTSQKQPLIPQEEEAIEKAEWIDIKTFIHDYKPVYKSVTDVVQTYIGLQ